MDQTSDLHGCRGRMEEDAEREKELWGRRGREVGRGGAAFAVWRGAQKSSQFIGRASRILWVYSMCPPCEEPIERVWEEEAKLVNLLSIKFKGTIQICYC